MTAVDSSPSRLVVRMPNWLGDVVMALPAVTAVRTAFPSAHLSVAAIDSIAPMFEERTGVRQQAVVVVDKKAEASRLRGAGADTIVLLPNSFRSAWVAQRSGIPNRWGYAAGFRDPLLTRAIRRPRGERHQSVYYAELVRALGIPVDITPPRIVATDKTARRSEALFEPLGDRSVIGFAPGAAYGHAKRWPPDRVAAVIRRLLTDHDVACVLVGAGADREAGRAVESSLPPDTRLLNLIGRTDLRLLIGVLARCRAFVSNDSGAMHLAAAAGVPVTAIFGPTNEKATAPLGEHDVLLEPVFCRPCMLRECPIDHRCMKRISADAVYASVVRRL
jgi:heptosyltransferase-2